MRSHKGTVPKSARILEYPSPQRPWDVVAIDHLQLLASHQGSKYLFNKQRSLLQVRCFSPSQNKTAGAIAHALITSLFCLYSTPRALLSDNRMEFRNAIFEEICKQFNVKETFTVVDHPAPNGIVERANRKILEVLRPAGEDLLENWGDWLPLVAASVNGELPKRHGPPDVSTGGRPSELFPENIS